jgi:beta-glucosidase
VRLWICSAEESSAHRSDVFTTISPAGLPASGADAAAAAGLSTYWNNAFPVPQCRGEYPSLMRPAIEPYIQPGDMARICRPVDWFGLNHYSPVYVKAEQTLMLGFDFGDKPPGVPLTPIEWPINPEAFGETLQIVHESYRLSIYVLENGFGNFDKPDQAGAVIDPERIEFLRAYIAAMNAAAASGVDVHGYFIWSLLDNFECIGVQHTVRPDLCRLLVPSAYSEIIV